MTLSVLIVVFTAALGFFFLGLSVCIKTPHISAPVAVARVRSSKGDRQTSSKEDVSPEVTVPGYDASALGSEVI